MIDYQILADAITFYTGRGYVQVEVPWMVGHDACFSTFSEPLHAFAVTRMGVGSHYLVGSAEQGFVELGKSLLPGKYISVSPCFRNETPDWLHHKTFMKAELHQTDNVSGVALDSMIEDALDFFQQFGPAIAVPTLHGYDIEMRGFELGSYGRRQHDGRVWLYGTGVALPRLSQITENGADTL